MSGLIDTTEMYLRTIYELEEEGVTPLRARIAERLGHSGPTVSQTIARMERDGLVEMTGERHLVLSEQGRTIATRVMRKHRIAERLLVDVIGLELEYVHEEACRWEHVMSERVERKILALLSDPTESPYGNPIPGLDELGGIDEPSIGEAAKGQGRDEALVSLADVAGLDPVTVRVRRIEEPVQQDQQALSLFTEAGLPPELPVRVVRDGTRVIVSRDGATGAREISLPLDVATHVLVVRA